MELLAKGDDLNARVEFSTAIKFKSDMLPAWRAFVTVNERIKVPAEILLGLRQIVALDPSDIDGRVKLARFLLANNAPDAASKVIEGLDEAANIRLDVRVARALILARMSDQPAAVKEAQSIIQLDSTNLDALIIVASDRFSRTDFDGALKVLADVKEEYKNDPRVLRLQLQAFARKGDQKSFEEQLQKMANLDPKDSAVRAQLAQLYIAQRRLEEAEKQLRDIVAIDPTDTRAGLDVVRFIVTTRGADAARVELTSMIAVSSDVFAYRTALIDLDLAQGRVDEATRASVRLVSEAKSIEQKIDAQRRLAEIYLAKRDLPKVEDVVAEMLKSDRRSTAALRLRASVLLEKGKIDEALGDIREALNEQPKSPELLQLMAIAYERNGQTELADRQYADALKATNADPGVALRYVSFMQRRGSLGQAEDMLMDVGSRHPGNADVLVALAQTRLARQNWTGALETADAIKKLRGASSVADQLRSAALAGQNKIDQSLSVLEESRDATPNEPQPAIALLNGYARAQKFEKALNLAKNLQQKFPDNPQVLISTGQIQLANNQTDNAVKSFKSAIEKQPRNSIGYSALADLHIREKSYVEASRIVNDGLKELPQNASLRLSLAGILNLQGDHEGSIAEYEAVVKDQPSSLVAINNLVSTLLDFRRDKVSRDRAIALSAALRNSNVPEFQDTLGWALVHAGDLPAAIPLLEQAKARLSNLGNVRYHLGMAYKANSQPEKAITELKATLDLEKDESAFKEKVRAVLKELQR